MFDFCSGARTSCFNFGSIEINNMPKISFFIFTVCLSTSQKVTMSDMKEFSPHHVYL